MTRARTRTRILGFTFAALLVVSTAAPARAVSKEMVELQTQVQQLLDMVQRLQSTLDARLGVLQHLAEQTADEANKTSAAMTALQQKLTAQSDASAAKLDSTSGQIQSLNDSVDEVKSRIAKLEKTLNDLQAQIQAAQQAAAAANPQPGQGGAPAGQGGPAAGAAPQAPPLDETFQAGVRDYNAAKYDVAAGEFQDVVRFYAMDDKAGIAEFYLGEISYRQQDYPEAIKQYTSVLEGFPGSAKAPAAQLHKGLALLQTNKREAGIKELRGLVQRHPQTPEAAQARTKLNGMGIRVAVR